MAQVTDGTLDDDREYRRELVEVAGRGDDRGLQLDLQSLKLATRGAKAPVISLAQGSVKVKQVDLNARARRCGRASTRPASPSTCNG